MSVVKEIDWLDLLKKLLAQAGGTGDKRKIYKFIKPVYGRRRIIVYSYNGKLSRTFFKRVCRDYSVGAIFWDALSTWIQEAENGNLTLNDKRWIALAANKYIKEEI